MAIIPAICDNETVQRGTRARKRRSKTHKTNECENMYPNVTSESSSESTAPISAAKKRRRRQRNKKKSINKFSKKKADEIVSPEEQSRYVAMDCEMVGTGFKGHRSAVARVTIIDWNGDIIMDEFVKPTHKVTDYRTFVSGITPQHLEEAELDIYECRTKVMTIIEGKILIGHALKNDLKALNITHPWDQIRDTAKYEPFMKIRFDDGILWPRKLKDLVEEKLHRSVQEQGQAHSPYEDAQAAFDLYRLVRRKWEKAMDYKVKRTMEIQSDKTSSETESD